MVRISLNNLLHIENDKNLVQLLTDIDEPISVNKKSAVMSGPRMGVAYITGTFANVLTAPKSEGGYNGYPVLSQFGYQHEIQYISAGNFNALIEGMAMLSGLEQGLFIPGMIFMNGFRFGEGNWEIAFGPSIGINLVAEGYYDENGNWNLTSDWESENADQYPIEERYDSRGIPKLNSRWIWAIGKTFRSGHVNIPCNIYCSPLKEGWYAGVSVGFNVNQR